MQCNPSFAPTTRMSRTLISGATMRQKQDVTSYMDSINCLRHAMELGEMAEFWLACRGLKNELKGVVQRSMNERRILWVPLPVLIALAMSAEIERLDRSTLRKEMKFLQYSSSSEKGDTHKRPREESASKGGRVLGSMSKDKPEKTRKTEGGDTPKEPERRCGVCGAKWHWAKTCERCSPTRCWRYSGAHRLADCLEPLLEKPSKGRKNDKVREGDSGRENREQHLAIGDVSLERRLQITPGDMQPHLSHPTTIENLSDSGAGDAGHGRSVFRS